ncbi:NAD-P-binding protein, partial [Stereum hirsutum FP-91666 SS1]|uniref:NAD-P-binding protein n=1 Tax=Stereum hirsutum (strain FP-91666) TaxID=721885 RepID=UPI000440D2FF
MSAGTTIFITGTTGYIGGSVLQRLLDHPNASAFKFTTITRSADKAKLLKEKYHVDAHVGDFTDVQKLEELSAGANVVIHTADADDLRAAKAILAGLKKRYEATGEAPILIHTSGTGVLIDDAKGEKITDKIYHDSKPEEIESLPETAVHRKVDLLFVNADKAGYIRSHIVLPSTIWGLATGPLVDDGIQNPHSIQTPGLIKAGLARGQAGMVGEGKNVWPNVNIDDVADLYILIFDSAIKDTKTPHGREGFYFGETGEHKLYDVCKAIAVALYEAGKSKTAEPVTFTDEECQKYFGGTWLGTNARAVSEQGKKLGWKPVHDNESFFKSIKPEVDALIASVEKH